MCNIKKVLIVDDDIEDLSFLFDFFEYHNCHCTQARTLAEAMKKNSEEDFDFFIVDMQIPAEDDVKYLLTQGIDSDYPGLAFVRYLRTHSVGGKKIIANTAHDKKELDDSIEQLGCRYVLKGRPNILKNVIKKSLGIT